ncbi:hypothetical protein AVEN_7465-1 [Araneus ventricosus]|uniref:Uncharacterized protein n=1 Tax=Araneus ventricosus TaxID=182803 RepID=A0A4Y2TNY7_ARAVE|nr:hypothetical protein AVEN_7465-1 [Araneus ventricosus]
MKPFGKQQRSEHTEALRVIQLFFKTFGITSVYSAINLHEPAINDAAGRGGLVLGSRIRAGGVQLRNPIPPKIRRAWGLLHAKSYVVAKCPLVGVAWELGEEGSILVVVLVV